MESLDDRVSKGVGPPFFCCGALLLLSSPSILLMRHKSKAGALLSSVNRGRTREETAEW